MVMFLSPVCDNYTLNSILLRMLAQFIEVSSFYYGGLIAYTFFQHR